MVDKFSFRKGYRSRTIFRILNVLLFFLLMVLMLVPLLKILSDSFNDVTTYGLSLVPEKFTFGAYRKIFTSKELITPLKISFYTTVLGTLLGLYLTTTGAYVLLQQKMPGRKLMTWMIFFTMIFSGGMIPTYLLIRDLHMLNTLWAVVVPPSISVYNLILMKSFMEGIPGSLMEAASIDGCSPMGIFVKIVLPLSKPALASIGLFLAVAYWNQFFNFVIYITNPNLFNFQCKLRDLILNSTDLQNANSGITLSAKTVENACIIVSMIPPLILYPFCQKYFVHGVTLGAVKE